MDIVDYQDCFSGRIPCSVIKAFDLLENAGFESFLVGGCVRDLLLGKQPSDFDLATSAPPERTREIFSAYPQRAEFMRHGTVLAVVDQLPLEITTYRIESDYTDYRRPRSVRFSSRLADDLSRRDFTINAMAYHPAEGLIDCYNGLADLSAGLIRTVGSPSERLREDALRIMRALRFQAELGFEIDRDTLQAMKHHQELLQKISVERIAQELKKLIVAAGAADALRTGQSVLAVPLPELGRMAGFEQHNPHHSADVYEHSVQTVSHTPPHESLRLAALLHDCAKPLCFSKDEQGIGHFYGHAKLSADLARRILRRLKWTKHTAERAAALIQYHELPLTSDRHRLKRYIHRLGGETLLQLIDLQIADNRSKTAAELSRIPGLQEAGRIAAQILAEQPCLSLAELAVDGHDMIACGLRGQSVGRMLQDILEQVIADQLPNDRQALLAFLKTQTESKHEVNHDETV